MSETHAASAKRTATSPASKEKKRSKEDKCSICSEPATEDMLECVWCEGRQHRSCTKISVEACNALGNIINNIVFFCSPCLQMLPDALNY